MVDIAAIESFVGSADGYVTKWYSQVEGEADLARSDPSKQPQIAENGTVITNSRDDPAMHFHADGNTGDEFSASVTPIPGHDYLYGFAAEHISTPGNQPVLKGWGGLYSGAQYRGYATYLNTNAVSWGGEGYPFPSSYDYIMVQNNGTEANGWEGNSLAITTQEDGLSNQNTSRDLKIGGKHWEFLLTEYVVMPSLSEAEIVNGVYANAASDLNVGPPDWNERAVLPQKFSYQVTLYDWLETITEADLDLPSGDISFQYSDLTDAEKAEARVELGALSATRVLRQQSSNLVLDDGNGGGIEGSGSVRLLHAPGGGEAKAWENEIAWWYQLDAPGFTNPYYQAPNVARRALVMTAVDMMMYHQSVRNGGVASTDQYGKAFHAWAYVYYHCKDILSSDRQQAFEDAFGYFLDFMIEKGPTDVNTNMDTFSIYAAAHVYASTNDSALKDKAVRAAKRVLLGDTEATVGGSKHDPKSGAYYPAGYVGENDSPETFYNSESYFQIVGAYNIVAGEADWSWLETVLRQMSEFRVYQHFPEPTGDYFGPSAYSGRTADAMIAGQNSEPWRDLTVAYHFDEAKPLVREAKRQGQYLLHSIGDKLWGRQQNVEDLSDGKWGDIYTSTPPKWDGWESWVKSVPYLPDGGWFSTLNSLHANDDPLVQRPYDKSESFNKLHGGSPTGPEFWSYKNADGSGKEWGFFVEALDWQGPYDTMSGGSLQYFWIRDTGALVRMSREQAGKSEDNNWSNIENWAVHHVWGRGASGGQFSSGMIGGKGDAPIDGRVATHDNSASPPYVEVKSEFNDPTAFGQRNGENNDPLSGAVDVTNRFEALSDGVQVTHTLTSDETDEVDELWATLPIFLRNMEYSQNQRSLDDTTIEYWDGSSWVAMPEDTDSDGTPEYATTSALRLGRDFGNGPKYGYVSFASEQTMRLSEKVWVRDWQANPHGERVRSVHIDLHGNPGSTKTLPASKSVSYTIQTIDPTSEGSTFINQEIPLQKGWNLVSTSVSPAAPAMDSVFADLQSEITVVENEAGEQYQSSENINEIGRWNSEEAYLVHAKSDVGLKIRGDSLGTSSIPLEKGWNWVSYFPSSPLSVEKAVSSIDEDLVLLKDETGRAYVPSESVNVLGQMEPGEGYKIYVQQSTTLTYPGRNN
jgi:hypothetical protein